MKTAPLIERSLTVSDSRDLPLSALVRALYLGEDGESHFLCMPAPVPPKFDTRLIVRRKGEELMVAALKYRNK